MAQWIARWTSDPEVVGSSPTLIVFSFLLMISNGLNNLPIVFYSLIMVFARRI